MNENSFWFGIWSVIIAGAVLVAISLIWINHLNEKQFIEHGYTREMLIGSAVTQWVKK